MKPRLTFRSKFLLFLLILLIGGSGVYLALTYKLIPDKFIPSFARNSEISFPNDDAFYIAVAGPISGQKKIFGDEMARGVRFCLDQVNKEGGVNGKPVKAILFDDQGDPFVARKRALEITEHPNIIMVIGHSNSDTSVKGGDIYRVAQIPAITASATADELTEGNDWYFRTIFNNRLQGAFLANYVKKTLNTDTVSIIYDQDNYGVSLGWAFKDVFKTLEGNVKYKLSFNANAPDADEIFNQIALDLKNKPDTGMILLATHSAEAVKLVVSLRRNSIKAPMIGGIALGDNNFASHFNEYPEEQADPGYFTNGIYAVAPVISDIANEKTQQFINMYYSKYNDEEPSWMPINYYEAALVAVQAIKMAGVQGQHKLITEERRKIKDVLSGLNNFKHALKGATGNISFDKQGNAKRAPVIGYFKNQKFISALTQFQPITGFDPFSVPEEGGEAEQIISVDDKPMGKTNVVYTGIDIHSITGLDIKNLLYTMDFSLWFRFQGSFNPADIEFLNTVKPIQLKTPSYQKVTEQFTYRLYKIKAQFYADFLSIRPVYGQHILGLSFRHKDYNRNQLIYVVDVLGMGLTSETSLHEELRQKRVLKPVYGWTINRSWLFPDIIEKPTLGKPRYINLNKGKADYSRFNFGIGIKKDTISFRRLLSVEVAVTILIVSILLFVLISLLSKWRHFQRFTKFSWLLRMLLTLFILFSGEIFILNWLRGIASIYYQERIIMLFDILWWVVPAVLIIQTIERFVWIPIEVMFSRTVPTIVRRSVAIIIFLLALSGVIAFVFNQRLTGLLATSGMLAMIVGLAAQINISNMISGIVLNIERSFRIGDWVKIGEDKGKIIDMTWRTTKLRTTYANEVSIPNGVVSESRIQNFHYPDNTYWKGFMVYIDPIHDPARVEKLLGDAILSVKYRLKPWVMFGGVNQWAATYWVYFAGKDYAKRSAYQRDVWDNIWNHLNRAGIEFAIKDRERHQFRQKNIRKEDPLEILEKIDILQPFSAKAKAILAQRMQRHNISSGESVMHPRKCEDSLFIIDEGVVGIWMQIENGPDSNREEVEVARLMAGDIISESKTAIVKAITDSVLYEITKADIAPFVKDRAKITERLIEIMTKRAMENNITKEIFSSREDEKQAMSKQFLDKIQGIFGKKR